MDSWMASFEVAFPASKVEELLLALVVRDLVHGASYDAEAEETEDRFQVDITASDEIDGEDYQLLVEAEITGTENKELAGDFLEQALETAVEEAEALVAVRRPLGEWRRQDIEFRVVPEDVERWDLVVPDWLAPEEAEVPFGFRSFSSGTDDAIPSNQDLDASGRIVVVPVGDQLHLFAIPAPEMDEREEGG